MLFDSFPAPVTAEARVRLLRVSDWSCTTPRQTTAEAGFGCGRRPCPPQLTPCARNLNRTSDHRPSASPWHPRISGSEIRRPNAAAQGTQHRSSRRQTRRETPATFPDMGDKLPEMTDQQPLPVESTVLRQLPHFLYCSRSSPIPKIHSGPQAWNPLDTRSTGRSAKERKKEEVSDEIHSHPCVRRYCPHVVCHVCS